MGYDFERAMDIYKEAREREMDMLSRMTSFEKLCYIRNKAAQEAENRENTIKQEKEWNEMEETKKNGIYNPKEQRKAPDWVIYQFGIKVDELPAPNEKGFINIQICKSQYNKQDGSPMLYAKINDWQPEKKEDENIVKIKDEEIPF